VQPVLERARSATRLEDGFALALAWDDELAAVFDEYLALTAKYTPDVERRLVSREGGSATLEIRGSAGFLQSFEASLARRGVELSD
jgi:hypothetical protein